MGVEVEMMRIRGRRRGSKEDVIRRFSEQKHSHRYRYMNIDTIIVKCPGTVFKDLYLSSSLCCKVLFPAFIIRWFSVDLATEEQGSASIHPHLKQSGFQKAPKWTHDRLIRLYRQYKSQLNFSY